MLAARATLAEEETEIEWTPSARLSLNDFRGEGPAGTDDQRVAATAGSLAWSYSYSVQWSRDSCHFRINSISSRALFHSDKSWVRPGHATERVLQHEQGHFDILQLYKQRFDDRAREFTGLMHTCEGRTERRATRDTQETIDRLVGAVYDEVWRDYRSRQETYDRETRHGTDEREQGEWSAEIESSLRAARGQAQ